MARLIGLVTDASGRYAHVWADVTSWHHYVRLLEDVGAEVIENQSADWDGCTREEIASDCLSIKQLLEDTDFMPHSIQ
jgi:hypothetical protein